MYFSILGCTIIPLKLAYYIKKRIRKRNIRKGERKEKNIEIVRFKDSVSRLAIAERVFVVSKVIRSFQTFQSAVCYIGAQEGKLFSFSN